MKSINEGAGSYVFTITADDGAKLIIDGVAQWTGWSKSKTVTVPLTAGAHEVVVEYYQASGASKISVDYSVIPETVTCSAAEWSATYFANKTLDGEPVKVDCFAELDETYASGSGPAGVAKTNYSARFVKTINEGAGSYVFTIAADDGAEADR